MKRREFIATTSLFCATTILNSKEIKKDEAFSWMVLEEVLEILFPKTENMPSAKEFAVIRYLQEVTSHSSFDKEDRAYMLQGSIDFYDTFPDFLESDKKQKENFIKSAMNSEYGEEWISFLIHYGIEAMLSDPIYGGNKNEIGWKSLNHQTGKPQPKYKYAKVV